MQSHQIGVFLSFTTSNFRPIKTVLIALVGHDNFVQATYLQEVEADLKPKGAKCIRQALGQRMCRRYVETFIHNEYSVD